MIYIFYHLYKIKLRKGHDLFAKLLESQRLGEILARVTNKPSPWSCLFEYSRINRISCVNR